MLDELSRALEASTLRRDVTTFRPQLFRATVPEERAALAAFVAGAKVTVVDTLSEQLEELERSRNPRDDSSPEQRQAQAKSILQGTAPVDFGVWVLYPWLNKLVHVLPEELHRELRLDRNRYKITSEEQARLLSIRVAVAGLSVGRAVVSTLVHEGIGGEIRIADFDTLSLSNLNRVTGGVADIGIHKAVLAAREIAEIDPYVRVIPFMTGVTEEALSEFVDGSDIVIDECDELSIKLLLRDRAKKQLIPVVMATSDRGMFDIERFDLEPERTPFHGLLDGVETASLATLTTKQKVPYVLRILDAERLDTRMAASLIEVKETLATWPQLASGVVIGGAMAANAVRRIALGELTCSGRFLADLDTLIADGNQAPLPERRPFLTDAAATEPATLRWPKAAANGAGPTKEEIRFVVSCAALAPSGGNTQPWAFRARGMSLRAYPDPARAASLLNFAERATFFALGAALESAMIGATSLGFDSSLRVPGREGSSWELEFSRTHRARDESAAKWLSQRCSNRKLTPSPPVSVATIGELSTLAEPLDVFSIATGAFDRVGNVVGALDRLQFMSPRFRRELFNEIRWTKAEALARRDGIDVAALELDATDLAVMQLLKTGAGLDVLTKLGRGYALGNAARKAFVRSGAVLVLRARDTSPGGLIEAGRGLQRMWIAATKHNLAIHPWGSPFLFQRLTEANTTLDDWERDTLAAAAAEFRRDIPDVEGLSPMLILRVSHAEPPSARSVRRDVDDVLVFD